MYIKLNPGISKFNLITYLLMLFVAMVCVGIIYGFVTFILEDPDYYNLTQDQAGQSMGYVGMISEAFTVLLEMVMGLITDLFGRKYPIFISFLLMGMATAAIPLFTAIYPWFCICRTFINFGIVIAANMPLLPDYVDKDSLVLANSYVQNVMTLGAIVSETGLY